MVSVLISLKKLGTRISVRIVISNITLLLGKTRFNLHHSTCNVFSRNITQDKFYGLPAVPLSSAICSALAFLVLCAPRGGLWILGAP